MDGDTFIGLCWHEVKAYCKRCEKSFKFGYNSAGNKFAYGDYTCPICNKNDEIETNQHVDLHIEILRSFAKSHLSNDEGKKRLRKEINELLKIQRIWLDEDECK